MISAFCDTFEREMMYAFSMKCRHARVGWPLFWRSTKRLAVSSRGGACPAQEPLFPPRNRCSRPGTAVPAREQRFRRSTKRLVSTTGVLTRAGSRCTTITNQTGGIKMRDRIVWILVGIVLVFVLALVGTGFVVAAMHGD